MKKITILIIALFLVACNGNWHNPKKEKETSKDTVSLVTMLKEIEANENIKREETRKNIDKNYIDNLEIQFFNSQQSADLEHGTNYASQIKSALGTKKLYDWYLEIVNCNRTSKQNAEEEAIGKGYRADQSWRFIDNWKSSCMSEFMKKNNIDKNIVFAFTINYCNSFSKDKNCELPENEFWK